MSPTRSIGLSVLALLLLACTPTFNWRALATEGAPLQALMPCKPDKAERMVPLAGEPTPLQMRSCDTGGMTFAIAWADVRDAGRVAAALDGWRRASLAAVQAPTALADDAGARWAAQIGGASLAIGLQATGRDHRGQPVQMQAVHATRGTYIVQAAVYGSRLDERAAATFFEGLRLP